MKKETLQNRILSAFSLQEVLSYSQIANRCEVNLEIEYQMGGEGEERILKPNAGRKRWALSQHLDRLTREGILIRGLKVETENPELDERIVYAKRSDFENESAFQNANPQIKILEPRK